MSVNDESTVSRQFVASFPPFIYTMNEFALSKRRGLFYIVYAVLGAAVFAFTMVRSLRPWMPWGLGTVGAIVVLGPFIWLALVWRRSRRKALIDIKGDTLTVSTLPGRVFSFDAVRLGSWATMGVALHLQSRGREEHEDTGDSRFVLGGRDRRIAPGTPFDAPPVTTVDAWLWSSEFDELLAVFGGSSGMALREPAASEPTRLLLFPNPYLAELISWAAVRKQVRFERSLVRPSLFVDLDDNGIHVSGPVGDALSASASRAQVTATPTVFQPDSVESGDGSTYDYPAIAGLVIGIPGMQPLTIGCLDMAGSRFRFAWRGSATRHDERPAYVVSGGDLLSLAGHFGLVSALEDRATR